MGVVGGCERGLALPVSTLVGHAGADSAAARTHDCARPVRLRGSTRLVDATTGEVRVRYSSSDELDGYAWLPCGNRRASVCPSCSGRYKSDAWQLITTGLGGGKGIPTTVSEHPCTFATLTALGRSSARDQAARPVPGSAGQARLPAW